jgi:predicted metal-dependent hydrolase
MNPAPRKIEFGGTTIVYRVQRRRPRTSLALTVNCQGDVLVTTPVGISEDCIAAAVLQKSPWIMAQWRRQARLLPKPPGRRFVSGEAIVYLGRTYQFKVTRVYVRQASLMVRTGTVLFRVPVHFSERTRRAECRRLLIGWLRDKTVQHGERVCGRICALLGLSPVEVNVRDIGRRWGSCTPSGRVLLHWKSVLAPMPLFEYICAHEVCHILHRDHSAAFRRALDRALPTWRDLASRLESRGYRYDL